jgi:multicomponent K+:H+ antiporter subunit E
MKRLLPHPLLTLTLAVLWLLLVNTLSAGQLVLGLLLGWLIPFATASLWPQSVRIRNVPVLLRYLGAVWLDIALGSVRVARLILGRPSRLRPAFIVVPLDLETDLAISLLANTISLTPGTVSAQVSADRRTLIVHSLDTEDAAATVRDIKHRYEAPLKAIFESC